jgi:hypothetical protein
MGSFCLIAKACGTKSKPCSPHYPISGSRNSNLGLARFRGLATLIQRSLDALRLKCAGWAKTPEFADCLAEVKVKMPSGARVDELFGRLRPGAAARAAELALALVGHSENGRAAS